MDRPRLFLSAVSEELRTARQAVARTVRNLGFDPVSQDDFPIGYGELRQWLREQLDSCDGLIQLVGEGYGAEPPDVDPEYGRVSYTQFEFLHAHKQKKKIWIIVIGKDFPCDKPLGHLDLPRDPGHPDPTAYQAERRTLQQQYLAQRKQENHLRHTASNPTELDNIVLRLRDELSELRKRAEQGARRLTRLVIASLFGMAVLGGGGWWGYQQLERGVQAVGVVNKEKVRAHLRQATEETHRREVAEAEAATDWKTRQRLREAADEAHRVRLSRIEELAISFAEIEGRGSTTSVFQEMTRILTEQGVDEAIAYVGTQQAAIFNSVRARAAAARQHNRADLQPLLQTAGLHRAKGQAIDARKLYTEILALEPDWPDALHAYFWFLADQGDLARIRATLVDARREYDEAHRLAQRLMDKDPSNTEWQRDLSVSHNKIGDVLVAQGDLPAALTAFRASLGIAETLAKRDAGNSEWQRDLYVSYWRLADMAEKRNAAKEAGAYWKQAYEVLSRIDKRGLHLTPDDRKFLAALREKIRAEAQ